MDNSFLLVIVLLVILIFFVTQIPRHKIPVRTVYVKEPSNRSVIVPSIWNYPTTLARPMRPWGPRFIPGFRPGRRPGFRPWRRHRGRRHR